MSDETIPEAATATGPTTTPAAVPEPPAAESAPAPAATPAPEPSARTTTAAARPLTASSDDAADAGTESSAGSSRPGDVEGGAPALGPDGQPKRRRRRGSRGGRNRRKPGTGAAGAGTAAGTDDDEGDDDEEINLGHDYNDAAADRGLTTDDVADVALEEAGLTHTPRPRVDDSKPAPKPRIGDSRPAPAGPVSEGAAASTNGEPGSAPKRRRRRGGRGRGRGGAGAGAGGGGATGTTSPAGTSPGNAGGGRQQQPRRDDVVHADLGVGEVPMAALDDDILERRRGRTRKGRPAGRYLMCVHVEDGGHTHIAVLEGRSLVEHSLATPTGNESIDGNIYFGRVQNVLPGMEAAFVDIGTPKNGVLYRGDVAFDKGDVEGGNKPKIERMLKNGQMITVQVTKNPIAHKGARLTQEVSLAGRFLVMVPGEPETYGISKRLPDDERKRLRKVLDGIRPNDAGLIVRTAAEGATTEELERDVRRLRNQWEQISALANQSKQAKLLYQEPAARAAAHPRGVHQGVPRHRHRRPRPLRGDARTTSRRSRPSSPSGSSSTTPRRRGSRSSSASTSHEQLLKALDRKVWLPSGGSLIIERTEALTVIDVNTGKNVGKSNLEETVFRNNLEAAEEVARQLRLRDIGGIIVIDFIDMEIKANRDETMRVVPRRARPRQDPHPGVRDVGARPGRDDPQARLRGSGGVVQRDLPHLQGPGVRPRRGPAASRLD